MTHPLDAPVWTALTTSHAAFAEGTGSARRYHPSIVPFAAMLDGGSRAMADLSRVVRPGESVLFLQAAQVVLPPGFRAAVTAQGVQMIAAEHMSPVDDARIARLGPSDAEEMMALAALTRPGPFTTRALELGAFWGVRRDGRLVAMAGERMKQPGYTEVSGVCTHPDARGAGLARLLSLHVAATVFARGETPYLHAYASNAAAIALYETLGFRLRRSMTVVMAEREA